jgi:GNAT superfamily N-acetyltransferase
MLHDPLADRYWSDLYRKFPRFQFAMVEESTGTVVGQGNSVPLAWEGNLDDLPEEGWDWAFEKAMLDHDADRTPRIQCAIQIVIAPEYQGRGLSGQMVQAMLSIGAAHGLGRLIAPVRPSLKSQHPLTDIDDYVEWIREDGLPFDPWLRVHARLGGRIVKVCHQAMWITGTVAQWETWAGLRFSESGSYLVPGALVPVTINVEEDLGVYVEPNVWMVHD